MSPASTILCAVTSVSSVTLPKTTVSLYETPLVAASFVVHSTVSVVSVAFVTLRSLTMGGVVSGTSVVTNDALSLDVGPLPSGSVDDTMKKYVVLGARPDSVIWCAVVNSPATVASVPGALVVP